MEEQAEYKVKQQIRVEVVNVAPCTEYVSIVVRVHNAPSVTAAVNHIEDDHLQIKRRYAEVLERNRKLRKTEEELRDERGHRRILSADLQEVERQNKVLKQLLKDCNERNHTLAEDIANEIETIM